MGIWNYLFPQAGETSMLTRQCQFYLNQIQHLEAKVGMLEKEVRAERKRYDKFQATYYDQISSAFKLKPVFTKQVEPADPIPPPELTPVEEQRLADTAKALFEAESDGSRSLYDYEQAVRANPEYYLSQ